MVQTKLRLLAGALGLAAARAAEADVSSLVQREASLHTGAAEPSDNDCECVGWKDAYTKYSMKCGGGRELDIVSGVPGLMAAMIPQMSYEFCKMYFQGLPNDNYCMNNKFGDSPVEWCYAKKGCQGKPASGGKLVVKTCERSQDATLGEMKFEELTAYAYRNKLELGLMVQFAYPTWPVEKLPDVQAFFGLEAPSDAKPISEELRKRLQEQVASNKTMFFTSRSGHPPYGVSEGGKFYYINFNPQKAGFDHKEDMNLWGCVAGCGQANKALW